MRASSLSLFISGFVITTALDAQNTYPYPASGYVGLGTTSPRQQLEVNGGILIAGPRSNSWSASILHLGDELDWYRYQLAVRGTLDSNRARLALFYHATSTNTYGEAFSIEPESLGSQNFDVTFNRGTFVLKNSGSACFSGPVVIGASPSYTNLAPLVVIPNPIVQEPSVVFPDRSNSRYSVGIGSRHVGGEGQAMDFFAGDSGSNGTNISAGARRMTLTSSGRLGLGTASPRAKFEIIEGPDTYGANVAHLLLGGAHGGGSAYAGIRFAMLEHTTGWGADIQSVDDTSVYGGALIFRTGGGSATNVPSERLRIASSGNIGIGTAYPTEKLSVKGKIRAQEIIVDNTGWADHVFEEGYKLASLSEVEQHIASKRRLPGIPSVADVDQHGISVGEMQAKLLEKVEELTLHQINQEKKLAAQSKLIDTLLKANQELRALVIKSAKSD